MQKRLLVTFHTDHAATALAAAHYAQAVLERDPTFLHETPSYQDLGRFVYPVCEFFEVSQAQVVDAAVYQEDLLSYQGETFSTDEEKQPTFLDVDGDPVNTTFIGHKWLVKVWYHC